jgi:hypothetical protein
MARRGAPWPAVPACAPEPQGPRSGRDSAAAGGAAAATRPRLYTVAVTRLRLYAHRANSTDRLYTAAHGGQSQCHMGAAPFGRPGPLPLRPRSAGLARPALSWPAARCR